MKERKGGRESRGGEDRGEGRGVRRDDLDEAARGTSGCKTMTQRVGKYMRVLRQEQHQG